MNLLDAEPLIIARLAAKIPGVRVVSAATVAGVLDIAHLLPAVFVQPGGADALSEASKGAATVQNETWYAIAVVKNVPDTVNLTGTYQTAGELIGKIVQALAGWAPSSIYRAMRYDGREDPLVDAGQSEFSVRFTTRRLLTGTGG